MPGLSNNRITKARRALKKLDKKAYEQGSLGSTGNAFVQAKDRLKDGDAMPATSYKGDYYNA